MPRWAYHGSLRNPGLAGNVGFVDSLRFNKCGSTPIVIPVYSHLFLNYVRNVYYTSSIVSYAHSRFMEQGLCTWSQGKVGTM